MYFIPIVVPKKLNDNTSCYVWQSVSYILRKNTILIKVTLVLGRIKLKSFAMLNMDNLEALLHLL